MLFIFYLVALLLYCRHICLSENLNGVDFENSNNENEPIVNSKLLVISYINLFIMIIKAIQNILQTEIELTLLTIISLPLDEFAM